MSDKLAPSERHVFSHQGRKVYEWDQTLAEVNVYVETPPGIRAKDMFCDILRQHIRFGMQGNPPFMDVSANEQEATVCSCACQDGISWLLTSCILTTGRLGRRCQSD